MKSLILKDLYNIGHNTKSMCLMILVFVFLFIPNNGAVSFLMICSILFSMMVMTTFTFDEYSSWTRYAMVTPVTRKEVVGSKFAVLTIFTALGSIMGVLFGTVGEFILKLINGKPTTAFLDMLLFSAAGFFIAMFFGSIVIPLMFRYGAANSRVISIVAFALPAAAGLLIYYVFDTLGITLPARLLTSLYLLLPVLILLWIYLMYRISYHIFRHQEI